MDIVSSGPLPRSPLDSGFAQLIRDETLPLRSQHGQFSPTHHSLKDSSSTGLLLRIRAFHKALCQLKSLSPNEETNAVFTELVDFVVKGNAQEADFRQLMDLQDVRDLCKATRIICAQAESLMEKYWANSLLVGRCQMTDFPYQDNYTDLTRLEYHALCGQGADPQHVLFIGSGPLPLSGLTLASQHLAPRWNNGDWSVLNVDICPQANKLGSGVARATLPGLRTNIDFLDSDATNIDPALICRSDVIYLAALVGLDMKCKESIIHHLAMHMKPGSRFLLRSATGLRRLLYPYIEETAVLNAAEGRLTLEVVCHPRNHVVNSVVIARRS